MIKKVVYTEYYGNGHYKGREVDVYHRDNCRTYYNDNMTLDLNVMNFMRRANATCENIKVSNQLSKRITTYR